MPLYGIDISNYKADIDLGAVPYDIVGFRATEGKGRRDEHMARLSDDNRRTKNRDEFYYHFVRTNSPEDEANNFIGAVRDRLRPQDCICLDWEGEGTKNGVEWARRWCQIVEPALGKRPWIYGSVSNLELFAGSDIADNNPAWVAWYATEEHTGGYEDRRGSCPQVPFRRTVAWQFAEHGHLPGYGGDLDLDEFYIEPGRMIDWAGNVGATPPPPPPPSDGGVGGRIGQRWRELGGAGSVLGNPIGDEVRTPRGAWRAFERGVVIWSPQTDAHVSLGAIRERYGKSGFEYGELGFPTTDELPIKDGGRWQDFERGAIYWSPATGAHVVLGRIRQRWGDFGWENGPLGYPLSSEFDGRRSGGRVQRFQGGVMYWTPRTDAHPVWGLVMDRYAAQDYEAGRLGYPVSDERRTDRGWEQDFEGGPIQVAGRPRVPVPDHLQENDPPIHITMRGGHGLGCACMQITLPLVEQDMLAHGLIRECIDFYQWGYNAGRVAASADTHNMGGVIDVAQFSLEQRRIWARWGVMMFPRTPEFGWTRTGPHGHGVWHGCPHQTASADKQVRDGMEGLSGLADNRVWHFEAPTRTWQDAVRAETA